MPATSTARHGAHRRPVANLLEAYRRVIAGLDWMIRETRKRASSSSATVHAQDRLPRPLPRLLDPRRPPPTTCSATSPPQRRSRPTATSPRSVHRSIATSGSCSRRRSTPTTTRAPTRSASRPASCRSRSSSPDADAAENYEGSGRAVIGHEIGHGFDNQGAQFDGLGNLNDWWTADDKSAFEVKSKALVEQYDGFSPESPGEHVNGALTVGENIGDLGGLTIGQTAYPISRETRRTWTAQASGCSSTGATVAHQASQGAGAAVPHHRPAQPPEFRANIVRNLDEFHAAFGTAEGDGLWLDPDDRVRIW